MRDIDKIKDIFRKQISYDRAEIKSDQKKLIYLAITLVIFLILGVSFLGSIW